MNQFLRTALTGHSGASICVSNISDDDAIMLSLSASEALRDIETATTALTRLTDTAASAEDTVLIASHIHSATPVELALLDNSLNHLCAGEGLTGSDIVPNMQSYEGSTVNMQSLKDMASSVWQAIKDLIGRIRDRIVKFFKSRWGDSAKLRKRLKSLIDRTEKMSGKSLEESKTEIGREVRYLTVKGSLARTDKDTLKAISDYGTIASTLFETWIKNVNSFGGSLETEMNSYDASTKKSLGTISTLNTLATQLLLTKINSIGKLFESTASGDARSPEGIVRKVIHLPGNVGLFATDAFTSRDYPSVYEHARLLSKARVALEPSLPTMKDLEEKAEIDTWSIDNIRTMCNELLSVLDVLDRYDDSKYMKDTEKTSDKITKAGDKLSKERQKQEEIAEAVNSDGVALQQYASAYASWTAGGFASFASNFNTYANGVTVIASKCLSNYK